MSRTYTAGEKATALAHVAACRGCVREAARASGVPHKTLDYWVKGKGLTPEVLSMIEESKLRLRDMFREECAEALEEAKSKRGAANYQQLMIGAGISADKAQLLDDAPTSITRTVGPRQTAEEALETLYRLARERDPAITLEVVRERLCELRPELGRLLMPGT